MLRPAHILDIKTIHALRRAAAEDLARRFGSGPWSRISLLGTARRALAGGTLFVFEEHGVCLVTFTLDREGQGFYLRSMSVRVDRQGQGVGRRVMQAVEDRARRAGLNAVRLDAYQGIAGAGGFYAKCGYTKGAAGIACGAAVDFYEKTLVPSPVLTGEG